MTHTESKFLTILQIIIGTLFLLAGAIVNYLTHEDTNSESKV